MKLSPIVLKKRETDIVRIPESAVEILDGELLGLATKVIAGELVGGPVGGTAALVISALTSPTVQNLMRVGKDFSGAAHDIADIATQGAQALAQGGIKGELAEIKEKLDSGNSQLKRIADEMKPLREAVENFSKRWSVTLILIDQRAKQETLDLETKGREAGGKIKYGFRLGQFMWVSNGVPVGPAQPIVSLRHTFICPFPNVQTFAVSIPPGVKWSYTLARWKPPMP